MCSYRNDKAIILTGCFVYMYVSVCIRTYHDNKTKCDFAKLLM